ncbi:HNH endonuclease family protein [Streptomyces tsukubensis]|uniref:HNH endonuclease family protein n=1 Tax=Streptomyces tsukubensis TaxID=83656 RepID=UPI00369BCF9B
MQGHHRLWPSDSEFRASLEQDPIYSRLVRRSVRILLEALEDELRTDHTEQLTVPVGEQAGAKLTIEHVMPQSWRDNWPPLENDLSEGADRDELVHTLGNLTLVTARLNPTLGNMAWEDKRQWLGKHSLLRLTHGTLLSAPPEHRHQQLGYNLGRASNPCAGHVPCRTVLGYLAACRRSTHGTVGFRARQWVTLAISSSCEFTGAIRTCGGSRHAASPPSGRNLREEVLPETPRDRSRPTHSNALTCGNAVRADVDLGWTFFGTKRSWVQIPPPRRWSEGPVSLLTGPSAYPYRSGVSSVGRAR